MVILVEIWTFLRTHTRDKSDFETQTFEKYKNIVVAASFFFSASCYYKQDVLGSLLFCSITSAVWSGLWERLPDIRLQVLPLNRLKMSPINKIISLLNLVLHVCNSKTWTHIRIAGIWNQWTSGYEMLSEILRLIPDILTVTKAELYVCVCVCVHVTYIHLVQIGCFVATWPLHSSLPMVSCQQRGRWK